MLVNTVQERLSKFGLQRETVAKIIAEEGLRKNIEMGGEMSLLVAKYPDIDLLNIAFIQSLIWARYVKNDEEFVGLISKYLKLGDERLFNELYKHTLQYTPQDLEKTIKSWRSILAKLAINLSLNLNLEGLLRLQERIITTTIVLSNLRQISNFGAWFCCAPFLAIAINNKDYWEDERLDKLTLPLGVQVIRGINWLTRNNHDFAFATRAIEETNIADSLATTIGSLVFQKELATLAKSKVLHINTGLWVLGNKGDATV